MISTQEYFGGGKRVELTPGTTYRLSNEARWLYLVSSGGGSGASTVQFPVSDRLRLGCTFVFLITAIAANPVRFVNGKGDAIFVLDKDGVPRADVTQTSGNFGPEPAVEGRLISAQSGGIWTLWSTGDEAT